VLDLKPNFTEAEITQIRSEPRDIIVDLKYQEILKILKYKVDAILIRQREGLCLISCLTIWLNEHHS